MSPAPPAEQQDGRLVIFLRDDYRRVGRGFTRWGAGLTLVGLLLGPLGWRATPLLGAFGVVVGVTAAVFALVGLLFWRLNNSHVTVDPRARTVSLPHHGQLSFDELVAVQLSCYVHTQRTKNGTTETLRHQLQLVTDLQDAGAMAQLDAMHQALQQAAADQADAAAAQQVSAMRRDLQQLTQLITGHTELVADHGDELAMWRAAEQLSRQLQVPVMDLSGEALEMRTPAELDRPLLWQLSRQEHPPADPGPAPAGLEVSRDAGALEVCWRGVDPWSFLALFLGGFLTLLAAVFLGTGLLPYPGHLATAAGAVALLGPGLYMLLSRPPNRLRLDAEEVTFRASRQRPTQVRLLGLEAVRVCTTLHNRVVLMSDEAAIRCLVKTEEQARWLGAATRHFLAGLALDASSNPYR